MAKKYTWIKIVTDIFEDEKILLIESMPKGDSIIVIWFKLLCLAGEQNNGGVFIINDCIAYTDELLSSKFRRPLNLVRSAMKTFEKLGMIKIVDDAYTIPNWNIHQSLDAYERKKEYDRNYKREKRQSYDSRTTSRLTSDEKSFDKSYDVVVLEKEIEKEEIDKEKYKKESDDFDDFWDRYPKKKGKADARKAFDKLNPTDELLSLMLNALDRQRKSKEWQKDNGQFIPYPATWLNGRRWEDEEHTEVYQTETSFDVELAEKLARENPQDFGSMKNKRKRPRDNLTD
ncbi:MAG: phage replisome organizer N-terminal domain-containing protein [Oscillospiraceae bacterium]|nr:phage replisome organizer N-terminal domain-containing protein [Oscillospiraceae bacterium]